jgi:hypothetical protein
MSKPTSKSLQRAIARDDKRSIEHRWAYGRAVLNDPRRMTASGKSLRHGAVEALIAEAKAIGTKLTEREIQYRLQCARAYKTINEIRTVAFGFESWSELREAGFPPIEVDEPAESESDVEPDDLDAIGEDDPYTVEPLFEIPGFKPVLKINGRKTDLADATVADAIAYRDMCREMHGNFGRTVAQVEASVSAMIAGSGGDLDANAVEAWKRGTGEDDGSDEQDAAEGDVAA